MGSDYSHFVWTQLSELQRAVGAIQESQATLQGCIEKLEEKLSGKLTKVTDDTATIIRVHHTTKWVGIVLLSIGGFALGGVLYVAKEVWELSKPLIIQKLTAAPTPPVPVTPVAPEKVEKRR